MWNDKYSRLGVYGNGSGGGRAAASTIPVVGDGACGIVAKCCSKTWLQRRYIYDRQRTGGIICFAEWQSPDDDPTALGVQALTSVASDAGCCNLRRCPRPNRGEELSSWAECMRAIRFMAVRGKRVAVRVATWAKHLGVSIVTSQALATWMCGARSSSLGRK